MWVRKFVKLLRLVGILSLSLTFGCVSWFQYFTSNQSEDWKAIQNIEKHTVLLKKTDFTFPLSDSLWKDSLICVYIGGNTTNLLSETASKYGAVSISSYGWGDSISYTKKIKETQFIESPFLLIVEVSKEDECSPSKISHITSQLAQQDSNRRSLFVVSDYSQAKQFKTLVPFFNSIAFCPISNKYSSAWALQCYMGGWSAHQVLSEDLFQFKEGDGVEMLAPVRLKYTIAEDAEVEPTKLSCIDSLLESIIIEKGTPSIQVFAARKGKVFYHKAFGYHTYDSAVKAKSTDLYDIASVSKITSGLLEFMKMEEEGLVSLDSTLGSYFPELKGTSKDTLLLLDILTHQSKLTPYIYPWPSFQDKNNKWDPTWIKFTPSEGFSRKITDSLYTRDDVFSNWYVSKVKSSKLLEEKTYVYSGVFFVLLPELIERKRDLSYFELLDNHFYKPLKMSRTSFNPLNKFTLEEIIPTEYDSTRRKKLIHGYVHDDIASVMGGKSSNAGLFSTANDLGKLMQMLSNGGKYGTTQFFKSTTVEKFTSCIFCDQGNRRGIGFDKRSLTDITSDSNTSKYASSESYGHLGFTGTYVWVDPKEDLVYVFLSNRVYPSRENKLLINRNIRTRVLDMLYESFVKVKK